MSDSGPQSERRHPLTLPLWAMAVGAITFAVFSRSLVFGLVDLDDFALLRDNPQYRGLSAEHLRLMFSTTLLGHYQPLTWLTFAIDHAIAGTDWRWYHFTSVLLHAINGGLVFLLCVRLVRVARTERLSWAGLAACAAGALFWSIHPLRVESVAWVTERRDVLSTMFLLGTALAYLRAFEPGSPRIRRFAWYAASIALLVLSLLSKSWGMSFFVVAAIIDVYPLRRVRALDRSAWLVVAQKLPYAVLGLLFLVIAGRAQASAHGAVRSLAEWPIGARIAQAAYGLVFYLWKSVSPTDLAALYEMPTNVDPLATRYLLCYAIVGVTVIVAWALRRRAPGVAAATIAYAVIVAPVLGFFQSGDQFVADRYSYVATIPWTVLLAGVAASILSRAQAGSLPERLRFILSLGAAAAIAVLAWLTVLQVAVWRDRLSLWQHAAMATPTALVFENLAFAYEDANRPELAIEQYQKAIALRPDSGRAWYGLGILLRKQNDRVGAEHAYREAAKHMPQAYMAWVNLGSLIQNERPDEALECFREAVRDVEQPRSGSLSSRQLSGVPYLALGAALRKRGSLDEARRVLTKGLGYADSHDQAAARLKELDALPR